MSWRLFACAAALLLGDVGADENIALAPPEGTSGLPEQMMIFIPGGKVPNEDYVPTAKAIQSAVAKQMRLWVVVPAVFQRLCIISCTATSVCSPLHQAVEDSLSLAAKQGWKRGKDDESLWLAGHSLGGTCANTLFQAYVSGSTMPYAGLLVMGGYVDESGDFDVTHFPKPVLTLNVELDGGLARPGKTAVWWRQHEALKGTRGEEWSLTNKPVIVLPKLNHSDFCPGFDVPGDLMAEVDQDTATATIAEVVGAFLRVQLSKDDAALDTLRQKVAWTRTLLSPYLKAQDMERLAEERPVSAEGSSSFCAKAQRIISGLADSDDSRLDIADGFHESPSNLEHCHPNWTVTSSGRLSVLSCSHTDYYADVLNTGSITAASEVACKMLSSDRVAQQLNTTAADSHRTCSDVNKYAVQVAEAMAAPSTLERYKKSGRGWCFMEDAQTPGNVGPLWVFSESLKLESNASCMAVTSPVLKTELDGKIYPGNHYCKFLSPARVLDWMMTDGLKREGASTLTASSDVAPAAAAPIII